MFFSPKCLFIFEKQWEREQRKGRERETEDPKQASGFWAASTEPNEGLELTNCEIMTWVDVGRLTDWATQAPLNRNVFKQSKANGHLLIIFYSFFGIDFSKASKLDITLIESIQV